MVCNFLLLHALSRCCEPCGRCACDRCDGQGERCFVQRQPCRAPSPCEGCVCGGTRPPAVGIPWLSVTKTASVGQVRYGETVEVTLTVTNVSGAPIEVWVRDADQVGAAYDGTGVAIDGVADATRDIRTGVALGTLAVGQAVTVQYNVVVQAYGTHCSSAVAWTTQSGYGRSGRVESNPLCLRTVV